MPKIIANYHKRLQDYEYFNQAYLSFFSNPVFKNNLVPINDSTGYFLSRQYVPTLRIYNENPDSIVVTWENLGEGVRFIEENNFSYEDFIYPYSRHSLLTIMSAVYDPIFGHALYNCFIETNSILNHGNGKGFATIVSIPNQPLSTDLHSSIIKNYSYDLFSQAIESLPITRITNKVNKLESYYDALHLQIVHYESEIATLLVNLSSKDEEIANLKNQLYINSQLTWR